MASILLDSVTVEFPIYHMNSRSIKSQIVRLSTGGKIFADAGNAVTVKALDNLSLHIEHGDRVGVIGHNGAGKSTLLRILSRIYEPSCGHLEIEGKVSPLLDIMFGIDAESTGYENIVMRGILLGLTRKEILAKAAEIAEFTELGSYLSVPIRTYSTGMQLRLAFAVATSIAPEILILDEVFGTGDLAFFAKAEQRMHELIANSNIVVLASHSNEIIEKFCNKVLLLEAGKIKFFGPVHEGLSLYTKASVE